MTNEPKDADLAADCQRLGRKLNRVTEERNSWKRWCEVAEAKLAALKAEPLAVGWVSKVQATEYVEGKTRLLVICADGSQGLGIDQPVTVTARDGGKPHADA